MEESAFQSHSHLDKSVWWSSKMFSCVRSCYVQGPSAWGWEGRTEFWWCCMSLSIFKSRESPPDWARANGQWDTGRDTCCPKNPTLDPPSMCPGWQQLFSRISRSCVLFLVSTRKRPVGFPAWAFGFYLLKSTQASHCQPGTFLLGSFAIFRITDMWPGMFSLGFWVQSQPGLHGELKVSQGYIVRPYLKQK